MKIIRMHKQDFGKIRGFYDILTDEGFTIKGFKIVEGVNGLFSSMPSEKRKDEYNDTVYCAKELREKLNKMAIDHYNNIESIEPTKVSKAIDNFNNTESKITEDEDLPF